MYNKFHFYRDAISKALYSRLFTWLVERINLIVCRAERDRSTSLAVLDIFGFEVSMFTEKHCFGLKLINKS